MAGDEQIETEEERRERIRRAKRRRALREKKRRRRRRIRLIRRIALMAVLVVAVVLAGTGIRKSRKNRAAAAAASAAAEKASASEDVFSPDEVLHLNFPVLTIDDATDDSAADTASAAGDASTDDGDTSAAGGDGSADTTAAGGDSAGTDDNGAADEDAASGTADETADDTGAAASSSETVQQPLTVSGFNRILQTLYDDGYVLVDIYDLASNSDDGLAAGEIAVPKGKKPLILSERNVSYTDGADGKADRLTLDNSGKVTCTYTDQDGSEKTGSVDVIPCVEDFIAAHPDFSVDGARGVIGLTGTNGILGYQTEEDSEIVGALTNDAVREVQNILNTYGGSSSTASGTGVNTAADANGDGTADSTVDADGDGIPDETTDADQDGYDDVTGAWIGDTESGAADGQNDSEGSGESVSASSADAAVSSSSNETEELQQAEQNSKAEVRTNVTDVTKLIESLRSAGWKFAGNSYGNISYAGDYDIVKADADEWKNSVGSIVGTTDILMLPDGGDLDGWSGYDDSNQKYQYLKNLGFKYYLIDDPEAFTWCQIRPGYVRDGMHQIDSMTDFNELMQSAGNG